MPTPRRYRDQAARQAAYRRRLAQAREREQAARGLPALPAIATMPGEARWQALIRQAGILLASVHEEMEEYSDERSETWQESERGTAFLEHLQAVEEAQRAVEELCR